MVESLLPYSLIPTLLLALVSFFMAVLCAWLELKYVVAICAVVSFGFIIAALRGIHRIAFLSFLLVFLIPVNLDINFFVVKHVGGAASISISGAWCVAVVLFLIFIVRNRGRNVEIGAEFLAICFYIVCGLISLVNAVYPMLSIFEMIRLLMLSVVMLVVLNVSERDLLEKLVFFIAIAVCVQSIVAMIQFFTRSFPSMDIIGIKTLKDLFPGQKVHRAMGTLGHPNFLGYYLELNLPVVFGVFLISRKGAIKLLSGIALLLGTASLVMSKSRGAWVAYPFAMIMTVFLIYGKSLFTRQLFVKIVGIFILATVFSLFLAPAIIERFVGKDYQALAIRMPLNKAALSIIHQYPLVGVGMNNFSEVFKFYDTTGHSMIFKGFKHVVHNLYLLVATETGILGLIALLSIFAVPFFRTIKVVRFSEDLLLRGIAVGGAMGLWAHLIHGFIDPGFLVSQPASLSVFFIIGLIGSSYRISLRQRVK